LKHPKVDPSAGNNWAIQGASKHGNAAVVGLLLRHPKVDPSSNDNYAIRVASENGHAEVVKLLLARQEVDPSADNNWAIRRASSNGHVAVVKLLLKHPKVDPSANNNRAIQIASQNGHVEIVDLLLDHESGNKATKVCMALTSAASNGHLRLVELLMEKWGPSSQDVQAAMIAAAKRSHTTVCICLLQSKKCDLNDISPAEQRDLDAAFIQRCQFYAALLNETDVEELKKAQDVLLQDPWELLEYLVAHGNQAGAGYFKHVKVLKVMQGLPESTRDGSRSGRLVQLAEHGVGEGVEGATMIRVLKRFLLVLLVCKDVDSVFLPEFWNKVAMHVVED